MGDKRPDWRRRQSEMGIRFNPVRGAESRPIPGEIVARQQRKPKHKVERDAGGGNKLHMRPAEVYDLDPEDRFNWLQSALLLAGRGDIKADTVYDIIASSKFASGVGGDFGSQMKASLLANLHLFKKEQQKAIKSDIIHVLSANDAGEVGKTGDAKANGTPAKAIKSHSGDDDRASDKSRSRKSGKRKSSRKRHSSDRSCSRSRRRSQSRSCSHSRSCSTSQRKPSCKRSGKASRKQRSEHTGKKAVKDVHKGRKRKRSASSSDAAVAAADNPRSPKERSSPEQAEVKEIGVDAIAGAYKEMAQIAQEEEEEAQRLRAFEQQALERKQKEEELRRTLLELAAAEDEQEVQEEGGEETAKAKKKKDKKAPKSKKVDK